MNRTYSFILLMAAACILPACLKTEATTVVHPDGTLTRTLIFTGDSATVAARAFPLPLDSSWSVSVDRADSANVVLRAVRTFDNHQAMNLSMRGERGKTITVIANLEKQFRWFFTTYDYTERWKCYRTVEAIPLADYVSNTDIDLFYTKDLLDKPSATAQDSSKLRRIDERHEDWRKRNIFESYFRVLRAGIEQLRSPRFSVQDLEKNRESVFGEIAIALTQNPADVPKVKKLFADAYRSDIVTKGFTSNQRGLDSLKALLDFDGSGTGKIEKSTITLPGIILFTNAEALDGSTGTWKDAYALQYFRDVELQISSRVINWWAVIVSGIVVAGLLAYVVIGAVRKRRNAG